ncbi:MAG: hypothetical protein KJ645_00740, partial [Planctomycetes bacterium]|nr:hypothetical protein [Planctomycetota bacterium]
MKHFTLLILLAGCLALLQAGALAQEKECIKISHDGVIEMDDDGNIVLLGDSGECKVAQCKSGNLVIQRSDANPNEIVLLEEDGNRIVIQGGEVRGNGLQLIKIGGDDEHIYQ